MNIAALDEAAGQETAAEALEWRKELITRLSDYCVICYEYGWKEKELQFGLLNTKIQKLADGSQCDRMVFWSDQKFGQGCSDGSALSETIRLLYRFDGRAKKLNCRMSLPDWEGFWQIGLEITSQMQLVVYLGNKSKYVKSEPLILELV